MLETDLAWAAGFIDADGSVSIQKRGNKLRPYLNIYLSAGQNSIRPLMELQKMFGGNVYKSTVTTAGNDHHAWHVATKSAGKAIELILPYIKEKREELSLALRIQGLKKDKHHMNRYSDTEHLEMMTLYEEFRTVKDLRKRGRLKWQKL